MGVERVINKIFNWPLLWIFTSVRAKIDETDSAKKVVLLFKNERRKTLTLQSRAYFLASIMAAFLSRSDSNVNTNDRPFLGCQNNAFAAALPSALTPHN